MQRFWFQIAVAALSLLLVPSTCRSQTGVVNPAATPATTNPYNVQLQTLERAWTAASAPERAVLLHQIYGLREYVDDASAITRWTALVSSDGAENRLVRDEALHCLALMQVHSGHIAEAEDNFRQLGLVRQWMLAGPFTAAGISDLTPGPEAGYRPGQSWRDGASEQPVRWQRAPALGPRESLDLAKLYPNAGTAVVFATASVYADTEQKAALRYGADSALAIFVNGQQVASQAEASTMAFDQHAVGVVLRPGWNAVVLKLSRAADGPWRFALRITAPEGGGLALRQSAAQVGKISDSGAQDVEPVQDLVEIARAAAAAEPKSGERLETLGLLERERGRSTETLQAAARVASTAAAWLQAARACADSTCSFAALNAALQADPGSLPAQSALAEYYFGRGQLLKARDLLRRVAQAAPRDFVARKRLADVYVAAGLNSLALPEYRKLEAEFPAPLWLRRELAVRYEDLGLLDHAQQLARSALAQDIGGQRERDTLVRIYRRRGDVEQLRTCYAEMARLDPADPQPLEHLAELDAGGGQFASAEASLRLALAIAPDDAALHARLADILSESGDQDRSRRELRAALALNPNSESLRLRLQSVSVANRSQAQAMDTEAPYLVNASALAAAAQKNPPRGDNNTVELADVRVEHVYDNGLSAVRVQRVFYIATERGAREYASRSLQYAAATQVLRVLAARVYKADGRVIEAEAAGDRSVGEAGASMYYDARSRVLHFPTLEKGDVIELDYRLSPESDVNPYSDYFGDLVVFRSATPKQLQRYVLIAPAARHFNVLEERMPSAARVRVEGSERVYDWTVRDIPALASEPRGPALTEVAPYVHVSTFASWLDVGRWYARLIAPQFTLDHALRQALQQILQGKTTEVEKISAIHQFVLRNTHYVALEFGIYGYKPYPVSQVYARRYGDCKDKASLMVALLRATGIEADIALVRTRQLGEIGEQATSVSIFNHAIVYVPKYNLWLDGTAEYAGSRELPLDDQGAMALTVAQDGEAQLRRIPVTLPMENYTHRSVQAQVEPDGRIQFSGSAYTRGEDAPGLRRELEVAERQRDSFRNRLAEVLPSVRVETVQVYGAHNLEDDVTVKFRGELDVFAGRATLSLQPSWMRRSYVQTLAPLASRTQDLLLPAPWTTEEELHFALPAAARLQTLPPNTQLDTPYGTAVLRYQRQGNQLVVTTSVQFRRLRITPAEYAGFRNFCAQVDSAFRSEIRVALRG